MNRLAQKKKVCALIPARLNSVRFPGKALKQIDGIPMVVRVLAAARGSGVFDAVYAATDSPEIAAVCQTYGFEAVFTSHSHQNPTSRIQEAVTILEDSKSASSRKFDFYAMIGGDEPLLTPEILQNFMEQALTVITSKENVQRPFLINAMADIPNDAETADPSNIKVVCRPDGYCKRQGTISRVNETIVCLPHKLVAEVESDGSTTDDADDAPDVIVK